MTRNDDPLRARLFDVIRGRVLSQDEASRREALADYLAVTNTAPNTEEARNLAALVPPVLPELYDKWIGMFLDRLFETVPRPQIELLCDGSAENEAAAVLAYLMFLESARMEEQVQKDLEAYGLAHSGDADHGGLVAGYLRSRIVALAQQMNDETEKGGSDTTH